MREIGQEIKKELEKDFINYTVLVQKCNKRGTRRANPIRAR